MLPYGINCLQKCEIVSPMSLLKLQKIQFKAVRENQLFWDRLYLYEDGPDVDTQLAAVNTTYNWGWEKADAEHEYDIWINNQGE